MTVVTQLPIAGSPPMQNTPSESLHTQSLKMMLATYAQRTQQAESMVAELMRERLSAEQQKALIDLMIMHMEQRSTLLSVQQQALLQALALSLDAALQGPESNLRSAVIQAHKSLTLALGHMVDAPPARTHAPSK